MNRTSMPATRLFTRVSAPANSRQTMIPQSALTMVAHADSITKDAQGRIEYHYTILDFAGRYTGGEAIPGDDASACAWAAPEELDGYNLWSEIRRVIEIARKAQDKAQE